MKSILRFGRCWRARSASCLPFRLGKPTSVTSKSIWRSMRDERAATTTGDPDETAIFALGGGLPLRRRPLPDHGTRDYDDGVPLTVGQQANRTPLLAHSIGEFDRWRPPLVRRRANGHVSRQIMGRIMRSSRRCAHRSLRSIRQSRRELPAAPGVPPTAPWNDMFVGTHA